LESTGNEQVIDQRQGLPGVSVAAIPVQSTPERAEVKAKGKWGVMMVACGILLTISIAGMPYYMMNIAERVRSPMHPLLKPSGYIGQAAGFVVFALFLFIWLYPLRKKIRFLAFTGNLTRWLDLHILAGLIVPWLGAIHAGFRFDGLIGMAYISMILVSLSGVVGRYLYTNIPRSASGIALNKDQINAERSRLIDVLSGTTGIEPSRLEQMLLPEKTADPNHGGLLGALKILLTSDLIRIRALWELRRRWASAGRERGPLDKKTIRKAVKLAKKEIALTQRLRMLDATDKLFRFWHVAHRPFAITALVGVMIHVGVVVALGVTWVY
jgi:hypothetical protein